MLICVQGIPMMVPHEVIAQPTIIAGFIQCYYSMECLCQEFNQAK